ncbi:hypothetical protein B0A48_04405 [Cryoendolithus antarcticus]|uniref:Beta-lactamase-related domain-containing protein n=1 Tax=Cryoendolithus antarcticus TaxID=1507870 RepID=A0A1V8TF95_9PEZI|nr:hypothetical protein B0A48_04405 [Cryoendolithus antarcticus]
MIPFTPDFDEIVAKTLKKWHTPGIAFSVVHNDETSSKQRTAYGLARLPAEPATTSTLYYVCSTTKAILCAAWAIYLASPANIDSDGSRRISWSTPMVEIIRDDFVLQDATTTYAITLEDCVSHRTGVPRHEPSYGRPGVETSRDIVRNLRNLPIHNTLRTHFEYCNTMYVAASHALEVVTGSSNAETFRKYLWDPLEMHETYGGMPQKLGCQQNPVATGYTFSHVPSEQGEAGGELREEPNKDLEGISGAGYVMSTADDYAKWMRCLLDGAGPLSPEMIKELWTPRTIVPDEEEQREHFDGVICYCLGWFKATYRGQEVVWHPGGVTGAGSCVMLLPKQKWGVTFFANIMGASALMSSLAFWLIDDLLSTPTDERKSAFLDQQYITALGKERDALPKQQAKLYPDVPDRRVAPLSLPAESYAGTYQHAGYGSITLVYKADSEGAYLYAEVSRTFGAEYIFRPVNGEHWLGERWVSVWPARGALRARSKIGADGKLQGFEIAMEPEMPDTMMWFARTK